MRQLARIVVLVGIIWAASTNTGLACFCDSGSNSDCDNCNTVSQTTVYPTADLTPITTNCLSHTTVTQTTVLPSEPALIATNYSSPSGCSNCNTATHTSVLSSDPTLIATNCRNLCYSPQFAIAFVQECVSSCILNTHHEKPFIY